MTVRTFAVAAVVAGLLLGGSGCARERKSVTVVVTPEVAGNGVATMLAERFTCESSVPVSILVHEARFVMPMIDHDLVDVVITTSAELQANLQRSGRARLTSTFAFNDYLIVGPKRDRAGVDAAESAPDAFRRIALRDRPFCSPVDVPELRDREAAVWARSAKKPKDDRRYRLCRGTAEEVLREADRRDAYTLTDRATFERVRHLGLAPLLQRTPMLHNDYSITLIDRGRRRRRNGEWFVQWVMSFRGREAVQSYRYDGERRLFVSEP